MIRIENIVKTYAKGSIKALNEISFSVEEGEIFGLIGPDGAGKSTLFRILTTLLLADGGYASVNQLDVVKAYKKVRECVGYMPGKFSLYHDLSVEANLQFFASVFNTSIEKNYHLVKEIYQQLEPFKNRRAGKLSGGMKQKLALCCALIHEPRVLFLDEPTTGVDVVSRKEFWSMLSNLKQQGLTILVSTPYMDEAAHCDRLAFMQHGTILSINTPGNFIHNYPQPLFAVKGTDTFRLLTQLRIIEQVHTCFAFGESIHLTLKDRNDLPLFQQQIQNLHSDIQVNKIEPGLEDCFIELLNTETWSA